MATRAGHHLQRTQTVNTDALFIDQDRSKHGLLMRKSPLKSPSPARLKQKIPFDWTTPPARSAQVQVAFSARVRLTPLPSPRLVAGVDVALTTDEATAYATAVVVALPKLNIVEQQIVAGEVAYPYYPGLLAYREGPIISGVLKKLMRIPDVIIFDGAGVAHPRRFGLASHLGILFDVPTIGCAKTQLIGSAGEPGPRRGDFSPMTLHGETVGVALRTRENIRPVYISPGHLIDLPGAIEIVLATTTRFRVPEPIRHAHRLARRCAAE